MKITSIGTALWLLFTANLAFADKSEEELTKQKNCITGLENLTVHYERANDIWLGAKTSTFSLERRFNVLLDLHSRYRNEVFQLAKDFERKPTTPENALELLRDLESENKALLATIEQVSDADQVFTRSADAIDEAYAHIGDRTISLDELCRGFADATLKDLSSNLVSIRNGIIHMRGYVSTAGQKRSALYLAVYHGIKASLISEYATLQIVPINQAKAQIDSILYADAFVDRVEHWWKKSNSGTGLSSGLVSKYLQFFLPMRTMQHDLIAGKELVSEIQNQTGMEPHLKQAIEHELNIKIGALEKELKTLEDRGPSGSLNLQKATNQRRKTMLSQLGPDCATEIAAFEDAANKTDPDLSKTERLYAASVNACQKKEVSP